MGPYSQRLIFFLTDEWAQKARVLHYTKLERVSRDKDSCLLSPFARYEENEGL